ncbi:hypothetical protein HPB49_016347 [Dermacentor silvarum]|uniref:Uncharacterized protein n=1 Tax=Dermacentor silvarum TaxID=543639 RepID=A0ACB8DQ68_DERSI|nr:hypothetical protein HPB49_016347 [Dermacentor silvarum]
MEVRNIGYALTTDMVRMKAQAMAHAKSISHEDFKASAGWVGRFLKRKGFSFRRRATLCQQLPDDYTDKVLSFQKYVIGLRHEHNYELFQKANADQIAVWFDCPENCTVEVRRFLPCRQLQGRDLPQSSVHNTVQR